MDEISVCHNDTDKTMTYPLPRIGRVKNELVARRIASVRKTLLLMRYPAANLASNRSFGFDLTPTLSSAWNGSSGRAMQYYHSVRRSAPKVNQPMARSRLRQHFFSPTGTGTRGTNLSKIFSSSSPFSPVQLSVSKTRPTSTGSLHSNYWALTERMYPNRRRRG